jgi:predicted methyltransferase
MRPTIFGPISILTISLLVAACDPAPEERTDAAVEPETPAPDVYQMAVAAPGRPEADRARDSVRMPAEVLRFFGIDPGMRVLDVFAGGGYYTEIVSNLLGPDGQVVMYNNQGYVDFTQAEITARFTEGRLANVEFLTEEVADLNLEPGSFDAALFILAYHDVYFVSDPSWPAIDSAAMLAEIHQSLRPGAIVGVVEHAAVVGSGTSAVASLHRIERAALVADFEAAGFVLEAESEILSNPDDDHSRLVFEEEIRGHTDRFLLRFRRP